MYTMGAPAARRRGLWPAVLAGLLAWLAASGGAARGGEAPAVSETPALRGPGPAALRKAERARVHALSWADKVVVIQLHGPILGHPFGKVPEQVNAALDKAAADGARAVVMDIDSPGGDVDACGGLAQKLLQYGLPTTALVRHKATSGGAMLALACQRVVMLQGSHIGDVQPMQMDPAGGGYKQLDEAARAKLEAFVKGQMKAIAEPRNRPAAVLEAMVTASLEVTRVEFAGGQTAYCTADELSLLEANIVSGLDGRKIAGKELVSAAGQLLDAAPREALRFGIADEVFDTDADFHAARGWDEASRVAVPLDEAGLSLSLAELFPEDLPDWAKLLLMVFLVVAVAGLWLEFYTPGFGIPGTAGLIGLVGFFSILMMHERGSWLGIALFIVGVALLLVEIALIPGFGVVGIAGAVLLLGGLFLAYMPDVDWSRPAAREYMDERIWSLSADFVVLMFAGLGGGAFLTWLVITLGSRLPGFQSLFMAQTLRSGREVLAEVRRAAGRDDNAPSRETAWIGRRGIARTPLRPAGKITLDGTGEVLDVTTGGDFLEAGAAVRVVSAEAWRIVVAPDNDRQ